MRNFFAQYAENFLSANHLLDSVGFLSGARRRPVCANFSQICRTASLSPKNRSPGCRRRSARPTLYNIRRCGHACSAQKTPSRLGRAFGPCILRRR
ncbi:hypothetical protein HMPREF1545_02032 [Oscillibacter sp. KLE 1728]|nr:hypothetical protein HMPREF1545_02032 [Oscillibacter sp. KLE 1728]